MNLKRSSIDSKISERLKQWEKQQNQVISIFITGISCETNHNIINHLRQNQTVANIDAIGQSLQSIQIEDNSKCCKSINTQFLSSDVISIILHYYNSLMLHLTFLNNTSINEIVFKTNTSTSIMSPNAQSQSKKIDGYASLSNTKIESYQFRYFTPAQAQFTLWTGLHRRIVDQVAASHRGQSLWLLSNCNKNSNSNGKDENYSFSYKLDETFVDGGLRCGATVFVAPLDKVKKVGLESTHQMLTDLVGALRLRHIPKMLFITEINKFKQLMLDEYGQTSNDVGVIGTNTRAIAKTVFEYRTYYRNGEHKVFDLSNDQINIISNYCRIIGDSYSYDMEDYKHCNNDHDDNRDDETLEMKEKFEAICEKAIQFVVDDLTSAGVYGIGYHLPVYLFDGDGFTQMQTENSKTNRVAGNIFYLAQKQALSIW